MTVELKTLQQINEKALAVLTRELGVADTLRFMMQFSSGEGNYTKEREQWLGNLTLDEIVEEMERKRAAGNI